MDRSTPAVDSCAEQVLRCCVGGTFQKLPDYSEVTVFNLKLNLIVATGAAEHKLVRSDKVLFLEFS